VGFGTASTRAATSAAEKRAGPEEELFAAIVVFRG
jgi:hypothetical protein